MKTNKNHKFINITKFNCLFIQYIKNHIYYYYYFFVIAFHISVFLAISL